MSSASVAHKFKNKLTKKQFACPACQKQLRVPIRPGKVLQVTCSRCQAQFQVSFKNPISEVFQWSKGYSMAHNLRFMANRFKMLPMNAKASLFLFVLVVLMLLDFLLSGVFSSSNSLPLEMPLQDLPPSPVI